ncbi:unnamed protein product [Sphagnum tenellum]
MNARGLIHVVNISGGQNGKFGKSSDNVKTFIGSSLHLQERMSGQQFGQQIKFKSEYPISRPETPHVKRLQLAHDSGFEGVMAAETTEIPGCVFTAASEKFASKQIITNCMLEESLVCHK